MRPDADLRQKCRSQLIKLISRRIHSRLNSCWACASSVQIANAPPEQIAKAHASYIRICEHNHSHMKLMLDQLACITSEHQGDVRECSSAYPLAIHDGEDNRERMDIHKRTSSLQSTTNSVHFANIHSQGSNPSKGMQCGLRLGVAQFQDGLDTAC